MKDYKINQRNGREHRALVALLLVALGLAVGAYIAFRYIDKQIVPNSTVKASDSVYVPESKRLKVEMGRSVRYEDGSIDFQPSRNVVQDGSQRELLR